MNRPFRELIAIDPKVFDDPATVRGAAVETFAAWARQLPVAPKNPAEFIRSVEPRTRYASRLFTVIAERKVHWRKGPAGSSARVTGLKLEPDSVDPWAESQESLRQISLSILACAPCAGAGAFPCSRCKGTQSVRCPGCGGARKAYGYASNGSRRLMNCKQCGATGALPCTHCDGGRVPCSTCRGTGREEQWLEFVETSRTDILVMLENEELRGLPWASAANPESPAVMDADAKLLGEVGSRGALTRERAAVLLPEDWLQANWGKVQLQPGPRERIRRQLFQVFEVPSIQVSYAIADAPPTTIHFEGRRMLAPPTSVDRQFAQRARKVWAARALLLALAVGIPLAYLFRGLYFWSGWVVLLALCLGASAVFADRFVRERTLGRKDSRLGTTGAAVAAALAAVMAVAAEPRIGAAERYLAEGRLDAARRELDALGAPETPSHQRAWATLNLAHALQGKTVEDVSRDAVLLPEDSQERAKVNQHLYELTRSSVLDHLQHKNLAAALSVITTAAPALRKDSPGPSSPVGLAELSAQVHDTAYDGCTTEPCRWKAATEAVRAAPTPEREQRSARARAALVERLTPASRPQLPSLEWLQRLDQTLALAQELGQTPSDADLEARARQAARWAQEERQKIPLIGADRAVAAGLLQLPSSGATDVLTQSKGGVTLYCSMKEERCTGAYVVGSSKDSRVLNAPALATASAEFLSQALGHPSELPAPPKPASGKAPTLSTWKDGKVTLVARWNNADLMELRIGEAKP